MNKKNPSLTCGDAIQQICSDLFHKLQLNAFSYSKIFSNGARAELWSNPQALEHTFLYKRYVSNVYTPTLLTEYEFLMYEPTMLDFPTETYEKIRYLFVDLRELFNHDNCFLILNHQLNYTEYFMFYTPCACSGAITTYFTYLDELKQFCQHFKQQAKDLILACEQSPLILPWRNTDALAVNTQDNVKYVSRKALTPREQQICDLLIQGLTARQVSDNLFIECKTVEKHIEHIKQKFGCNKTSQVIYQLQYAMAAK